MGSNRRDAVALGRRHLTQTAQVVPELATFAVDDGFTYAVPDALSGVRVGSVVRVPLGRRRVRGYVVGLGVQDEADPKRPLREVFSLSGDIPIFDERMLKTLRWISTYYVAPLAAVLPRSSPPNLPRVRSQVAHPKIAPGLQSPLPDATASAAAGRRLRPHYLVTGDFGGSEVAALVSDVLAADRSALVVAPTVVEAGAIFDKLRRFFGSRAVMAHSSLPAGDVTAAWTLAATNPGMVVIGTREVALWPIRSLAMGIVVEEGRRAMKAAQTPTMHVREILRRRAVIERFQLVFAGPVPTVEVIAAGCEIREPPGRVWPLVEVVDRNEEPPGSGFISDRVRQALTISARTGKRVFVLVNRRGYAPAFRCVRCKALRRCATCGTAANSSDACRRCGVGLGQCAECNGIRFEPLGAGVGRIVDELKRIDPRVVAAAEVQGPLLVGTERDLAGAGPVDIAIAIDADSAIYAPTYRAAEDALRLLARLAALVRHGAGNRCLVQTASPDHAVMAALRRGHPMSYLQAEVEGRAQAGFPPASELTAIEISDGPDGVDTELRQAMGPGLLGPAEAGTRQRWLVEGSDLREAKIRLRRLVQQWRDAGARVRIDVDPIDL